MMTCGDHDRALDKKCGRECGHEGRHEWKDALITMSWPNYAEMLRQGQGRGDDKR